MGLGFVFTARDMASGTIRQVGGAFGALDAAAMRAQVSHHRNMQAMAAGIAVMGAGLGVLAGAGELAEMAGHFEQALARLGGVSRATADEMQMLHDKAIQVGVATMFDPTEAVEGLTALAEKGFTAREQMSLIMPAAQLAEGGAMEIATAAEAMSAAVRVFGQDAAAAADDADMMLASQQTSALQARDMVQAFAGVSRGASLTKQSLSEMLIAMGFVRDTGADVSVSAQSVSSALVFMASRADKFKALGVSVTDAHGNFRPFLDIVRETSVALQDKFPDAADRTANALELFSRFGLQAYAAVNANLERGIHTTTGEVLHGAAAIDYLRSRFQAAAHDNAAEEFQQRLLSTFAGQQRLLRGSIHTLGIIVGEGFTAALKPYVSGVVAFVNRLIGFFQQMPAGMRTAIAHAVMLAGAAMTVAGAFVGAAAAIALVAPLLKAMVVAAGGLVVALAPFVALLAVAAGAVAGFRHAAERDVGGIGARFTTFVGQVRLGMGALVELFTQGGFSAAVRDELDEGHVGLRRFVINVYAIGFRVVQFFRGVWIGFQAAIEGMGPTFSRLGDAFGRFGRALGFVSSTTSRAAGTSSGEWAAAGTRIGVTLSGIVEGLANAITLTVDFATGVIDAARSARKAFESAGAGIGDSLSFAGGEIEKLLVSLGVLDASMDSQETGWRKFGRVVGTVVGSLAIGVGMAFAGMNAVIGFTARFVDRLVDSFKALYNIAIVVWRIASGILGKGEIGDSREARAQRENDSFSQLGSLIFGAGPQATVEEQQAARAGTDITGAVAQLFGGRSMMGQGALPAATAQAAQTQQTSVQRDALDRVANLLADQRKHAPEVTLVLDGEKLAASVIKNTRRIAAADHSDVASEE